MNPAAYRRSTATIASLTFISLVLSAGSRAARDTPPSTTAAATTPAARSATPFGKGLRINWRQREIELDGVIVNRDCPLELFACAGGMKNHESIINLAPRPVFVFQALGLLGCRPGSPAWWDEKTNEMHPAHGDAVDVLVRWNERGMAREASACDWLLDLTTDKPLPRTHWIFAGSVRNSEGQFGADVYGTVITVVDFGTSVLAVAPPSAASQSAKSVEPASRPASDAAPPIDGDVQHGSTAADLSLAAIPERIPAIGTRVVVVLKPRELGRAAATSPK